MDSLNFENEKRLGKIKFLNEQIKRREGMINTYKSLIRYWDNKERVICASSRLNQSEEFIQDTIADLAGRLIEHEAALSNYNKMINLLEN